ncbi:TVP38/TMEM64 family protein [Actinoplanes sp. G11-F43]|uniref:TVP38/TMEM64 family protein n=1 Tax=Actinoplanes sp. G11-F43 TaxID=3424130 RepID=UPI003D34C5D7
MFSRNATARLVLLIVLVLACAVTVAVAGVPEPERLAAGVVELGVFGPVAVVGGTTLLLAALVPRSVLAAGAGLVFGPLAGGGYVLAGAALAALLAFGAGRVLGREFVAARGRLAGLDAWLARRGVLSVALMRILPIAPFGLVSYGFGTTAIRVRHYLIGTAIGAAPSTLVYATLGDSALSPGSPGFALSIGAAVLLAAGGAVATAILRRPTPYAELVCPNLSVYDEDPVGELPTSR